MTALPARRTDGGHIGVIGSINTDLVTHITRMPNPGETLEARAFTLSQGGKGANQAVAAARLGAQVTMVGRVGDDLFGHAMRDNLARNAVNVDQVHILADIYSGVAPIFVDTAGNNSILIVKGANGRVDAAAAEAAVPALRNCNLILMQLEIALDTIYHTVEWANAAGIEVWLNPAPAAPELDLTRLAGLGLLTPNQTELALLTGLPADTVEQAEHAARQLIARGIGRVVVTLGEAGALLVEPDRPAQPIAPVAVRAVDTTGAGDAFIGALAAHHVRGFPFDHALRRAVAYAADSVTRPGAQEAGATRDEFETFLAARGLQ